MTTHTKDVIRILVQRLRENPDTATVTDAKKLAKALLMLRNGEPLAERVAKDPTSASKADLGKLINLLARILC